MSEKVSYGFQWVDPAEKTERVTDVFRRVARNYDIMNDVMSAGLHRVWKDYFVDKVRPREGEPILDMAGGTGDIAFRMAKRGAIVTVSDINPAMLEVGKERAAKRGLELNWSEQNAETLTFDDASFSAYTISFGIRNVTDIPAALREAHRVLKIGGRFFCMEFSKVELPLLAGAYDWYSFNLLPKMGEIVAKDREAYQYLAESIRRFPDAKTFERMIREAGFSNVRSQLILGGVVAIHSGWKV